MTEDQLRIYGEIVDMFNKYSDTGDLITAITMYIDHEKFASKYDGAIYAMDKIKEGLG